MKLTVLYFQLIRTATGTEREDIELSDPARVEDLISHLEQRHPNLRRYVPTLLIAVNEEWAERKKELHDGDTVALMPPVSGG